MSWRTVVIRKVAKLSYKNGYMVIRGEEVQMMHLSEIGTLIIESTAVSVTSYLLVELLELKIGVIFCDEKRNPFGQLISFQGSHNSSETIQNQINWNDDLKDLIWMNVIKEKIRNQANVLLGLGMKSKYGQLMMYSEDVESNDLTNREGIAAKVYFAAIFGHTFTRTADCNTNAALDYGYTILNSAFNREITAKGYLPQLGIHHRNRFNPFNLSSDLMEPYRTLIDVKVMEEPDREMDADYKMELVDILNERVLMKGSRQYVTNAISIYVSSVLKSLNVADEINVHHYEKIL